MTRFRITSTLIVWFMLTVALWLTDAEPSAIGLAGIVGVSAAIVLVSFDLGTTALRVRWPRPAELKPAGTQTPRERVPRPLYALDGAVRSYPTGLRSSLIASVDQRLATRYGVERRTDPARADVHLTPRLRKLVADPNDRIGSTGELSAIIEEIEAL
jgi:hypothetical protein